MIALLSKGLQAEGTEKFAFSFSKSSSDWENLQSAPAPFKFTTSESLILLEGTTVNWESPAVNPDFGVQPFLSSPGLFFSMFAKLREKDIFLTFQQIFFRINWKKSLSEKNCY